MPVHVYEFDSEVRGHQIYKTLWAPLTDETQQVVQEDNNKDDEYTVAIRDETIWIDAVLHIVFECVATIYMIGF